MVAVLHILTNCIFKAIYFFRSDNCGHLRLSSLKSAFCAGHVSATDWLKKELVVANYIMKLSFSLSTI